MSFCIVNDFTTNKILQPWLLSVMEYRSPYMLKGEITRNYNEFYLGTIDDVPSMWTGYGLEKERRLKANYHSIVKKPQFSF